jgi:beta-N-acetylhexosaminidase
VGGLVFLANNITSGEQITTFNTTVQTYSKIPLFITCDEEGGRVGRLKSSLEAHSIRAMLKYKDDGKEMAFQNAVTLAQTLKKYGFNMDLAPVADVWSNPKNTVIGDRAFSDDFEEAATLVASAVKGFKSEDVISVLKHFPGHGDTSQDSHYGSAYVTKTLAELRQEEFLPFSAGIDAGADMVMLGHLIVSDVDETPATLSYKIVTDILRGELGFEGIVITDALNMQAMLDHYGAEQIATETVKAGVDILLSPPSLEKSIDAIIAAVESGEIPETRIDESVRRILTLKMQLYD